MQVISFIKNYLGVLYRWVTGKPKSRFPGTGEYWERRYTKGGDSGFGSYGKLAFFKAKTINEFLIENKIKSVIEFGCGDGNQIKLIDYPSYLGFDISETSIRSCQQQFRHDTSKSFKNLKEYQNERSDLSLSLDVIYHLVEDSVFEDHLRMLFDSSFRYVIIYSSNTDNNAGFEGTHIRQRCFTNWIEKNISGWKLINHIPNQYPYKGKYRLGSMADFYIYQRN